MGFTEKKTECERTENEHALNLDLLYGDIVDCAGEEGMKEIEIGRDRLQRECERLEKTLKEFTRRLEESEKEQERLREENERLVRNISSLYDTAKKEITRKEMMLKEERMKSFNSMGTNNGSSKARPPPPPPMQPKGPPPANVKR